MARQQGFPDILTEEAPLASEVALTVIIEHHGGGASSRIPTPRSRAADALRPMLTVADDEDAREESIAEVERLFAEGRLLFDGDPPIELAAVDVWPRALTWSDEQVEEVERWLAWYTTKGQKVARPPALPEVLRG